MSSPFEQLRGPTLTPEQKAARRRLGIALYQRARERALAVLAQRHVNEYRRLLASEKAHLLANDERFEALKEDQRDTGQ